MSRTDHHVPAKHRRGMPLRPLMPLGRGDGSSSLSVYTNWLERRARAELRTFTLLITRVHRSGGDIEQLTEPDGRTRHRGHWDFW